MEKELIINGIKYVRYEEPKSYKIYDLVKYNGYKWIVINVKGDELTLMMKECLSEEKMKEIFNSGYLDEAGNIKYSTDEKCNDWNKIKIKRGLNNEFLKEFDKEDLVKMKTYYDKDKYSIDYIRIPEIREIERLDQDEIASDKSFWTMSPSHFDAAWGSALEFFVSLVVRICSDWVTNGYGVRPVITLKNDNRNIKILKDEG